MEIDSETESSGGESKKSSGKEKGILISADHFTSSSSCVTFNLQIKSKEDFFSSYD